MKILELLFIFFSKPFVLFSKRADDWFYLPIVILCLILSLNIITFSYLVIDVNIYYIFAFFLILNFIFIFLLGSIHNKGKEYVQNYKLSKITITLIILLLFVDFIVVLKTSNTTREKYIREKATIKINQEDYKLKRY